MFFIDLSPSNIRSMTELFGSLIVGGCASTAEKISLSSVFAGQDVGIREVSDKIWLVSFMEFDLGFFDEDERRVEPADKPIYTESVTHVSGMNCYLCLRYRPGEKWLRLLGSNQRPAD